VRESSFRSSPTTYFVVLAWLRDEAKFHAECLLIPSEEFRDICQPALTEGNLKFEWRPGSAADIADLLRSLTTMLFDPYRPERHYMRGPGPKWRAKHAPRRFAFDPAAASALPALVRARRQS